MTRDEARAIAIEATNRGDTTQYRLESAAQIEDWLMRPAISEEEAQAIRDKGPGPVLSAEHVQAIIDIGKRAAEDMREGSILGGEEIDLSSVAGLWDAPIDEAEIERIKTNREAIRATCTCPRCTAARAWRAADGHPADVPTIRTESMRAARKAIKNNLIDKIERVGDSLFVTTENVDRTIMAILRAINE